MTENPYLLPAGNVQIAFSGGRTSDYMLHQILAANGDLPEILRERAAELMRQAEELERPEAAPGAAAHQIQETTHA